MRTIIAFTVLVTVISHSVADDEWNTYRKHYSRSGVTESSFDATRLETLWTWQSEKYPEPAWDGPARWDAYNRIRDLPAMRQYDGCFHCVSDGSDVFFGSSSQDSVYSLDLTTGKQNWQFVAGGPVRLAPTIDGDFIYFGCDDGNVYCLNKLTGDLVWTFNPSSFAGSSQRRVLNNGRLISYFPIRTGVLVRDGIAYFGASLLPWRESYICAVDALTGKLTGAETTFVTKHVDATLEGNLLVTNDKLIVPQGRISPLIFNRNKGTSAGRLPGGGGVNVVLTEKGEIVRAEGGKPARSGQIGVYKGKERVASFPRGRAIVVDGDNYYVIDGQKLFAATKKENELKWSREVDEPLELIMAGETLFVGGRDHVSAIDSKTGSLLWSEKTDGRVFGLAIAKNHLICSTDSGHVQVFAPKGNPKYSKSSAGNENPENWKSPRVNRVREKTLLNRWVFHRSAMKSGNGKSVDGTSLHNVVVKDQSSDLHLRLKGSAKALPTDTTKQLESIGLSGDYFSLPQSENIPAPTDAITIETWVRIDQSQPWGSIVGNFRDDGSIEHGWLLGYRSNQFCFGLAGSKSGLTYLSADQQFETGSWNHVVGSYNGQEMRIYVNGSLAASSRSENGPISYGEKTYFSVGAYHDTDESFPLIGAIHEIRIYSAPMRASIVKKLYEAKANKFELRKRVAAEEANRIATWGPYIRYTAPGQAEIMYGTKSSQPSVIDLVTEQGIKRFDSEITTKEHKVTVEGLPFRRQIEFQIRDGYAKSAKKSKSFTLDTHFNWSTSSADRRAKVTNPWIDNVPNPRGVAIVVGEELSKEAVDLARSSQLNVVLSIDDQQKAAELRSKWRALKTIAYGKDLSVSTTKLKDLPAAFASVVIASENSERIRRLVRPDGGIVVVDDSVAWKRKAIADSGVWTHMYGQLDNSAYGGETLSGATEREDLITQWIGKPGPRYQTDRQNRKPSPLATGGRMYLQGQQRMIALDAYSGNVLWSVETPTVMRWNVPHDSSNWCADENGVFVASQHQAWFVDGRTGTLAKRYDMPKNERSSDSKHWGFIGRHKNLLIGSIVESDAIYTKWWGSSQWFDSTDGNDTHVVGGDTLFALDVETGKLVWKQAGLILHPTITVLDGRICFVQDTTDEHLDSNKRRISLDGGQAHQMVALDVSSGQLLWRQSLPDFEGHLSSFYLAGGGDEQNRSLLSVASNSKTKKFVISSYDPENGETAWTKDVDWETNHHGKHISRPAIQGDLVYVRPEVLRLSDGETITRGFPGGHGCSSYTALSNGIVSRLGETTWWDARTNKVNRFKRIRTDCWVSVIPAQGMLLSAEGGGGCSCGTWLETSLGFLPRKIDEEFPIDE